MAAELLGEVNNNYHMAIAFHREQADLFWFLSLPGFAMLHEYQYFEESLTQRRLKQFITRTYGVPAYDKIPSEGANVFEPLTRNKDRFKIRSDNRWDDIKQAWEAYNGWETISLKFYENAAHKLLELKDMKAFEFMGDIVKGVTAELSNVNDMMSDYSGMEWDLPQISGIQANMHEKYCKMLNKLKIGDILCLQIY